MKSRLTYKFADTEKQAKDICERINAEQSKYMTKKHPAHYTPWNDIYVCWYYCK